jgi:cellulose biosynthesis protein BcsQ
MNTANYNELKIINGISERELNERNKVTRLDYLNECLNLIDQDLFYGGAINIANSCVGLDDKLDAIKSLITFHEEEGNEEALEEMKKIKKNGYDYVNQDYNPFKFENEKEIIQYAIENCV